MKGSASRWAKSLRDKEGLAALAAADYEEIDVDFIKVDKEKFRCRL